MKSPTLLLLALTIALTAFACGPTCALAEEVADYSRVHTIAVISALGDDINIQNYGTTRFGNAQHILHTDWKIDAKVEEQISEMLSARFKVIAPVVDPAVFANIGPSSFETVWDVLQKRVQSLPKLEDIDAYAVVIPRERALMGESWRGLQITHSHSWIGGDSTIMTAYYDIAVINASDGKRISAGTAQYPASGFIGGYSSPLVACSADIWSENIDNLSDLQKQQIRQEAMTLIAKGLAGALTGANLISKSDAETYEQMHPVPPDIPQCRPL